MDAPPIRVVPTKLSNAGYLPVYKTEGAAAADLFAAQDAVVAPGDVVPVGTGLSMGIPVGWEVQIRPRSGMASRGIGVANSPGTIDADYVGEVMVLIENRSRDALRITRGQRIAQMTVSPAYRARFEIVESLPPTVRGEGAFGSTGS